MSNLQEQVRTLYQTVQKQKAEIASAEKGNYVTDGQFRYSNTGQIFDIRTVRHSNQLQEFLAFLIGKEKDFAEAGKELGLENEFTWHGATRDQWANDFKVRATQIELVSRKANLIEQEAKLLRIASKEFIAELELESIKTALGA